MAINLRLTDQQTEQLRAQADAERRSMQSVAVTAIEDYISRRQHKSRVRAAIDEVVTQDAAILKRLVEIGWST
jgi:predicted transcriptional regulator